MSFWPFTRTQSYNYKLNWAQCTVLKIKAKSFKSYKMLMANNSHVCLQAVHRHTDRILRISWCFCWIGYLGLGIFCGIFVCLTAVTENESCLENIWIEMVLCFQNCSHLLREKNVLVIENFVFEIWDWRSENLQNFWDYQRIYSNSERSEQLLKQFFFKLVPGYFSELIYQNN